MIPSQNTLMAGQNTLMKCRFEPESLRLVLKIDISHDFWTQMLFIYLILTYLPERRRNSHNSFLVL
jgi:hypothetical protein